MPQWCIHVCTAVSGFLVPFAHCTLQSHIVLLELWGVSRANCDWNSPEAPQFQYFNHLSDCSVQLATGLESLKRLYTVYSMYVHGAHFVTQGCHGHTECEGVSVSVLCNLKMTMQLLYVASVGLKSPLHICTYIYVCIYICILSQYIV